MEINEITDRAIGAAIKVHSVLGPGLLESAYGACLSIELSRSGLQFQQQVPVHVRYGGSVIDCSYRLDFLVENAVVIELKSVAKLDPIHTAQLLTYLRLSGYQVGLLINFNVLTIPDGLKRIVYNYNGQLPRIPRLPRL